MMAHSQMQWDSVILPFTCCTRWTQQPQSAMPKSAHAVLAACCKQSSRRSSQGHPRCHPPLQTVALAPCPDLPCNSIKSKRMLSHEHTETQEKNRNCLTKYNAHLWHLSLTCRARSSAVRACSARAASCSLCSRACLLPLSSSSCAEDMAQ